MKYICDFNELAIKNKKKLTEEFPWFKTQHEKLR